MDVIKNLKKLKVEHVILFLVGAVFLFYLIKSYSTSKVLGAESMNTRKTQEMYNQSNAPQSGGNVEPSQPLGQNETYASATGMSTSTQGLPPSCSRSPVADPSELLPKDTNSQWAQLNPSGSGDLQNVNLLRAGYHMGIDTIGNTLRNANLQLRSEPANPQLNVGPWNNTTIAPDTMRTPLELGQGSQ
jgi:uncharacterized iron-regulated membrane protein